MFFSLNETGDGLTPRLTFNGLNACFVTKIAMMHMAEIPAIQYYPEICAVAFHMFGHGITMLRKAPDR
jgi:hypothetical protein